MSVLTAIGLMSGTSLDGVDVALIETDGEEVKRLGPTGYRSYSSEEQDILRRALADSSNLKDRRARPGILVDAEDIVTSAHKNAVEEFVFKNGIGKNDVAIVGFHGQTVLHRPSENLTVQIGNGPELAKQIAVPVAYDFRAADVAAGGEGAPLVPAYHRALARKLKVRAPIVIVNIGGVANVTYLDGDADPIAFDTGPGNAPIDDLMLARAGQRADFEGSFASRGRIDEEILQRVLGDPFFSRKPPKSLDRATFAKFSLESLSNEDAAATATAIVAGSIANALKLLPKKPSTVVAVGGGAKNPTLMSMLQGHIGTPITSASDVGWEVDAMEAQAFAYLAVRTLKGLPLTFPTTTGVKKPLSGGVIAKP